MSFKVMNSLLNDTSLKQRGNAVMRITMIDRSKIHKNEKNGYQIGSVAELAEDIKKSGVAQPLEVLACEDGTYRLITGERRITAIDTLIQSGEWNGGIPCIIRELDDFDLPLSDEEKEMYAIIRTNRFTRKMTDSDIFFESMQWEKLIKKLKEKGETVLQIGENAATTESIPLVGKTREAAAQIMNISNGQMSKIESINRCAVPAVLDALHQGRVAISTAYIIAGMPKERQEKFMEMYPDGKIETAQVKEFQAAGQARRQTSGDRKESEAKPTPIQEEKRATLSAEFVEEIIAKINALGNEETEPYKRKAYEAIITGLVMLKIEIKRNKK